MTYGHLTPQGHGACAPRSPHDERPALGLDSSSARLGAPGAPSEAEIAGGVAAPADPTDETAAAITRWGTALAITPEFYTLVAATAISHQSEVVPLVRQPFPPRMQMRETVDVPERELVTGD